jgi:integrase
LHRAGDLAGLVQPADWDGGPRRVDRLEQGLWVDPRAGKVTLTAWASEWQRTVVHLRASTQRIYAANLRNHILPELGQVELGKLTPSMLRAWLSGLTTKVGQHGKALAPGSVAQAYRTLNRVLVGAVNDELLGRNPLRGLTPPQAKPEPMRFLSHNDVAALAAAIDPRYRSLVLIASYTGLRAGELIGLRRKHVDLLHRTITVVEQVQYVGGRHQVLAPKTAAGRRSVAVPATVTGALEAHLSTYAEPGTEGLVFPAPAGGYLPLENFRKRVWQPAVTTAGLAPLAVHDLRHTCGSLAIAAGADIKVLQRMLGHGFAALTPRPVRPPFSWASTERGRAPRRDGPCNTADRDPDSGSRGILAGSAALPAEPHLRRGRARDRSADLALFRRALYRLSYPTADLTGFEPATSGLTGRRALQTAPQVPADHPAPPTGFEPVLPP